MDRFAEFYEHAKWVLTQALGATSGTSVLVIHDEATESTAACLSKAAYDADIRLKCILVPQAQQQMQFRKKSTKLDEALRDEINHVSRVIVLQGEGADLAHFRFVVLEYSSKQRGKRIASMPGVLAKYLPFCAGDLDVLAHECNLYAHRLIWTNQISIVTMDASGEAHTLVLPVGDHSPRVSTGRVPLGAWCNVPSGETFIIPNLETSQGSVVIDGSLLGYPIPDGECLTFRINDGRVIHPVQINGSSALHRAATAILHDQNGAEVTPNCTVVSELGIGLNPKINSFTGIPLFDEKIAGTAHLGLGSSKQFRGPTASSMHNDFVMRHPLVKFDSDVVVADGKPRLQESTVFPNWSAIQQENDEAYTGILRTPIQWKEVRDTGRILARRLWISDRSEGEAGTQVGDAETAAFATNILWTIENNKHPMSLDELRARLPDLVPIAALTPTLSLLKRFRLITFG